MTAARLDASMALSASAVSVCDRTEGPASGRGFDADEAHVMGDDVMQLAGDRQPLLEHRRGRASRPVAPPAHGPDDQSADRQRETAGCEQRIRTGSAAG